MKRFIISLPPFVSLAVRTFSVYTATMAGAKLLTSKKISLLVIVALSFTFKAFSQTTGDGFLKIDSCFFAVKKGVSGSKPFCVGDNINVKLKDNKIIHGKISRLSKNYIITSEGFEIDVSKIKWIQNTKQTSGRAVTGLVMTLVGIALFPLSQEAGSFTETGMLAVLGVVLVPTGFGILVTRQKFRIEKGDKLIFKRLE